MKKLFVITIILICLSGCSKDSSPPEKNSAAEMNVEDEFINAIKSGEIDKINKLLDDGVDINFKEKDFGNTALIWATLDGNVELVKLLIERGADVKVKNKYGQSARIIASDHDYDEIFKLLIDAGAKESTK